MTFLGLSEIHWVAIQAIGSVLVVLTLILLFIQIKLFYQTTKHQVYGGLNEDYLDFMKRIAENPKLEVHDINDNQLNWYCDKYQLSRDCAIAELTIFGLLFSLWEHAYLDRRRKWMEDSQWLGWHEWMAEYLSRNRAIDAWFIEGRTYDEEFSQYVADNVIRKILKLQPNQSPDPQKHPPKHWPTGLDLDECTQQRRERIIKKPNINQGS